MKEWKDKPAENGTLGWAEKKRGDGSGRGAPLRQRMGEHEERSGEWTARPAQ